MQRCLSAPENNHNVTSDHNNVSHSMMPLLREWAGSRLTTGSWKEVLTAATGVSMVLLGIACVPDMNVICSLPSQDSQFIKSYVNISR